MAFQTPSLPQTLIDHHTDLLLFKTLHNILTRDSVTPEDKGCQQVLHELLASVGFKAYQCNLDGVTNTLFYHQATDGSAPSQGFDLEACPDLAQETELNFAKPVFCFAGHTDVVPVGQRELWTHDPFAATLTEGKDGKIIAFEEAINEFMTHNAAANPSPLATEKDVSTLSRLFLHARGATDMKSGVVSSAIAAYKFVLQNPNHQGTVCLLITSDEEGIATAGTKYVVEQLQRLGQNIDYSIVCEPSCSKYVGDTLRVGRRGSMTFYVNVQGVQGHVAFPHLVANPIHKISQFMNKLSELELDKGNAEFPPSSLQIVYVISGDGTTNLVPGLCKLQFNIRFNNEHNFASLRAKIEQLLDENGLSLTKDTSPYHTTLDTLCSGQCFVTAVNSYFVKRFVEIIEQVTQQEEPVNCDTSGGTSDGRFLAAICPHVVEFGVTENTLHKVNELVHYQEVQETTAIYHQMLSEFLLAK